MERRRRSTGRSSLCRQGQLEYVSQPVPLARLRTHDCEYDRAAELAVATPLGRGKLVFGRKRCEQTLVLSVDDDPVNQLVIQSLLVPEGYKVRASLQCMTGVVIRAPSVQLPPLRSYKDAWPFCFEPGDLIPVTASACCAGGASHGRHGSTGAA